MFCYRCSAPCFQTCPSLCPRRSHDSPCSLALSQHNQVQPRRSPADPEQGAAPPPDQPQHNAPPQCELRRNSVAETSASTLFKVHLPGPTTSSYQLTLSREEGGKKSSWSSVTVKASPRGLSLGATVQTLFEQPEDFTHKLTNNFI